MAVQLVTKINRYIGTAAELAALTLTGIPVGSTFFEADTGILKTLSAAGTLVVAPSETVALAAGTALAGKFVPVDTDGDEKFTAGNPASVQLSGRIPEYAWFTGAEQPIPADQTKFAWGYEFDETTGEISAYGWSGAAWVKAVI